MLIDSNGDAISRDHIALKAPVSEAVVDEIVSLFKGALLVFRQQGRREPFFLRNIIGGVNHEWRGIAPIELYDAYMNIYNDDERAFREAGLAAGRIFMKVLIDSENRYQLNGYVPDRFGKSRAQYSALD